jgi:hypothetical protein
VTGLEGELHNIGAVMVGDLIEAAGWRVRFQIHAPARALTSTGLAVVRQTRESAATRFSGQEIIGRRSLGCGSSIGIGGGSVGGVSGVSSRSSSMTSSRRR